MNTVSRIGLGGIAILFLANWSAENSTSSGVYQKHSVNYYGTVTTQQGKTVPAHNISIGNMLRAIDVYEVQKNDAAPRKIEDGITYITLSKNPQQNGDISKLDLNEVATISLPETDTLYTYQVKKQYRPTEYVKIDVVYNGPSKTKSSYLIENKKMLYFHETKDDVIIEHKLGFLGLKELTIQGFKHRTEEKENSRAGNNKVASSSSKNHTKMSHRQKHSYVAWKK